MSQLPKSTLQKLEKQCHDARVHYKANATTVIDGYEVNYTFNAATGATIHNFKPSETSDDSDENRVDQLVASGKVTQKGVWFYYNGDQFKGRKALLAAIDAA